jgi:peptidoglycan/LPS O-acetylase OafA/YrhL
MLAGGMIAFYGLLAQTALPSLAVMARSASALAMIALVSCTIDHANSLAGRGLSWGPLTYLGRISYGIYLYQFLAFFAYYKLQTVLGKPAWMNEPLAFAGGCTLLTIAIASGSWFLFEKPLLSLKKFFPYSRPKARPAPTPIVSGV